MASHPTITRGSPLSVFLESDQLKRNYDAKATWMEKLFDPQSLIEEFDFRRLTKRRLFLSETCNE
jgi:hypothetical protein